MAASPAAAAGRHAVRPTAVRPAAGRHAVRPTAVRPTAAPTPRGRRRALAAASPSTHSDGDRS